MKVSVEIDITQEMIPSDQSDIEIELDMRQAKASRAITMKVYSRLLQPQRGCIQACNACWHTFWWAWNQSSALQVLTFVLKDVVESA